MLGYDRVELIVGAGRLTLVDDTGPVQTGQVQLSAVETRDKMPLIQHFGFQSSPPAGSDVVHLSIAGDRGRSVVIASNHQPSRPKGLARGGVRVFDQGGVQVLIGNDGTIQINAPGETLHHLLTDLAAQIFNEHTHPSVGAPPTQQMTAAHWTTATRAGT